MRRVLFALILLPLLAGTLVPSARAQWSSDPAANLCLADRPSEQVVPKVASTSDGGVYVGWFDLSSGNYDVYLQRLDAAGVEQWPHNGILISDHPQESWITDWDLIVDSGDNAVLAFSDARDGSAFDVQAYKVSPAGAMLWGADGLSLTVSAEMNADATLVEASDGDIVVVWEQWPDAGDGKIRMQRISPAGVLRFPAGGQAVAGETGESPGFPEIVASLDGSVIVMWLRDMSGYSSPRHIRADRFSAAGASLWGAPVEVYNETAVPLGYHPQCGTDGSGGAVFCWHRYYAGYYNSAVQRLDADGNELFAHNGVTVSTTGGMYHIDPYVAFDPSTGYTFVVWSEENPTQTQFGLYAQKYSVTGLRMWGVAGRQLLPVTSLYKDYPRCLPLGEGIALFYCDAPGGGSFDLRVLGMRLDGSGNQMWSEVPVVVSSVLSSKARLPLTIDNDGVMKIVWEDDRDGTPDVYGQNVNPDGTLGTTSAVTVDSALACSPPSGTVPFLTQMSVTLTNLCADQTRLLAGRIDVTLAGGNSYSNWRSGYTNLEAGASFLTIWNQVIPSVGGVIGDNVFELNAADVTPAPYNQPPYLPSGDTDSAACTVTGVEP